MTTEKSLVETLRQAHTALLNDLGELERMANSPTGASVKELGNRLRALRSDVAKHFFFEEQNGYLSPVLKYEPRTERKARELLDDHRALLHSLDTLIQEVVTEGTASDAIREKVRDWLSRIRQHETREIEFFDEARQDDPC
jgi:hypothetical protein